MEWSGKLRHVFCVSIIIMVFAGISVPCSGQPAEFDHTPYDSVLQTYVKDGLVDYHSLLSDRGKLTRYLKSMEGLDADEFESWDVNAQMAFWINAYNAITIEGIIRNYPIKGGLIRGLGFPKNSIRQIKRFWKTVFVTVMGRKVTLDEIEHEILRKEFNDPRIHFVLVCASLGCPILESRAFLPQNLNERLDQATRRFIQDSERVSLDREKQMLTLSPIFKWYREDFELPASAETNAWQDIGEQGVLFFLRDYLSEADRHAIEKSAWRIEYARYDWSLNEQ